VIASSLHMCPRCEPGVVQPVSVLIAGRQPALKLLRVIHFAALMSG
jgi:hypothetical protein